MALRPGTWNVLDLNNLKLDTLSFMDISKICRYCNDRQMVLSNLFSYVTLLIGKICYASISPYRVVNKATDIVDSNIVTTLLCSKTAFWSPKKPYKTGKHFVDKNRRVLLIVDGIFMLMFTSHLCKKSKNHIKCQIWKGFT